MLIWKRRWLTSTMLTAFIVVNLIFIFLQIHKQSQFVRLSYIYQRLLQERDELAHERDRLNQHLHQQQNHKSIRSYAQSHLGLQQTAVHQVHKANEQ